MSDSNEIVKVEMVDSNLVKIDENEVNAVFSNFQKSQAKLTELQQAGFFNRLLMSVTGEQTKILIESLKAQGDVNILNVKLLHYIAVMEKISKESREKIISQQSTIEAIVRDNKEKFESIDAKIDEQSSILKELLPQLSNRVSELEINLKDSLDWKPHHAKLAKKIEIISKVIKPAKKASSAKSKRKKAIKKPS